MTIFVPEALLRHAKKREVALTIDTTTIGPLQIKNVVRMALSGIIIGEAVSAYLAKTIRQNLGLPILVKGAYSILSWKNVPKESPIFATLTAHCVARRLNGLDTEAWDRHKQKYVQLTDVLADRPRQYKIHYFYDLRLKSTQLSKLELGTTKELNSMLDKLIAGQLPTIELNYGG